MANSESQVQHGSANIFADIGLPDADSHLLKAQLVSRLSATLKDIGLTQTEAALRMGVSQPDVSRLLRGQFRDVSVERIMRMMTRVGCAVDIVVRPQDGAEPYAPIHLGAVGG